MKIKLLSVALVIPLFSACGGSSSTDSTDSTASEPVSVNMAGTWTFKATNSVCPNLEAEYLIDFTDTTGDGVLNQLTRFNGGKLININNCSFVLSQTEVSDIKHYGLKVNANKLELASFVQRFSADNYSLQREIVTSSISNFGTSSISYSSTFNDGTTSFTESGSITK